MVSEGGDVKSSGLFGPGVGEEKRRGSGDGPAAWDRLKVVERREGQHGRPATRFFILTNRKRRGITHVLSRRLETRELRWHGAQGFTSKP